MAKKRRRKRHRHPVAPPVHSAPGTAHVPPTQGPPPPAAAPGRGPGPGPVPGDPVPPAEDPAVAGGVRTRTRERSRRGPSSRRRRRNRRPFLVVGAIVAAIVVALVAQQVVSRRAMAELNRLAAAAGCDGLQVTGGSGSGEHLPPGQGTTYDTSPPTHGAHDGRGRIPPGIRNEPFDSDPNSDNNIFLAVHSLEHGYIIVWHDELTDDERARLESRYRGAHKVIVVPYPELERGEKMTLTAWGRVLRCPQPDVRVVDAFIDRFREARSAPEPTAA